MSNKRIRELEGLTGVELTQRLAELKDQLFQHRFRNSMRQLDNPLKIRNTRRDIARLETLIQREQSKSKGGTA
jgi:large subunit ribosomal protein L29